MHRQGEPNLCPANIKLRVIIPQENVSQDPGGAQVQAHHAGDARPQTQPQDAVGRLQQHKKQRILIGSDNYHLHQSDRPVAHLDNIVPA